MKQPLKPSTKLATPKKRCLFSLPVLGRILCFNLGKVSFFRPLDVLLRLWLVVYSEIHPNLLFFTTFLKCYSLPIFAYRSSNEWSFSAPSDRSASHFAREWHCRHLVRTIRVKKEENMDSNGVESCRSPGSCNRPPWLLAIHTGTNLIIKQQFLYLIT